VRCQSLRIALPQNELKRNDFEALYQPILPHVPFRCKKLLLRAEYTPSKEAEASFIALL